MSTTPVKPRGGVGGTAAAAASAEELPRRLQHIASSVTHAADVDEARHVAQQLSEAVQQMDADLRTRGRPAWSCGSTLVALLVTQRSLTVANLGDSRTVLCRSERCYWETEDHKPANPTERARIEAAGGHVATPRAAGQVNVPRLNGVLSVSRAFGDAAFKAGGEGGGESDEGGGGGGGGAGALTAEPEVTHRALGPFDTFLLLASDGLWDVMTSQEAVGLLSSARRVLNVAPSSSGGNGESTAQVRAIADTFGSCWPLSIQAISYVAVFRSQAMAQMLVTNALR